MLRDQAFHNTPRVSDVTQLLCHCWTITVLWLAKKEMQMQELTHHDTRLEESRYNI